MVQESLESLPPDVLWDVVIVGTGMGGATLGHALAQGGHRVLFVERGRSNLDLRDESLRDCLPDDRDDYARLPLEERLRLLARGGRSIDEIIDVSRRRPVAFTPFIGAGTGGSTALYGMALERLFPQDFTPRAFHSGVDRSTLPESWPISYDELRGWYVSAERLYRVRGTPDPLRPADNDATLLPSPPLTPANAELFRHFEGQGLHPYQLHIGCEHVEGCQTCQGYLCSRSCKNDSGRICLAPAIAEHGAHLLSECTVLRLEASGTAVKHVLCKWRGHDVMIRGRYVVLAAGALITPLVLLNSRSVEWSRGLANESDLVGRNLMRHCIDMVMVHMNRTEAQPGQIKELALNDFYFADGEKLGTLQSFGPLPRIAYFLSQPDVANWVMNLLKPLLCRIGERYRTGGRIVTTIMEDLPYAENRVLPGEPDLANGRQRVRLFYRLGESEWRRLKKFRGILEQILKPYRQLRLRGGPDNKAIAHVCGTCRFGDDPRTSVLDRNCRAHGLDNLYVVDASIFPSSGGINPSLTIAANALRVAEHLKTRL